MRQRIERSEWFHFGQDILPRNATERKLLEFRSLRNGWNFGEGVKPRSISITTGIAINDKAKELGFFETDAFPGSNGEVMLTIYYKNHYLEFIIEPDRTITFYYELNDEERNYEEGLSSEDVMGKIIELRNTIQWKQFESSMSNIIGIRGRKDLTVFLSRTSETRQESQLLTESAYESEGMIAVAT